LIAGTCHPEFVKSEGGKPYREYEAMLDESLEDSKLKWCKIKEFHTTDFRRYDIVFLMLFWMRVLVEALRRRQISWCCLI